ncbi:Rha family transcriptional regulator [Campylobacter lanienae]|uniref:Rha family transcriptional regulator n=1 Tax=Campylobacter lanienae TaxID=75658 RepID=UPI0021C14AA0|nr:Rha family transcriptional regulator [Campylobacter lanienae]
MNEVIVINNVNVAFEVVGDEIFANSLQIAEVFEKRHDNIITQIRALPNDDFNDLNFQLVKYSDKKGEARPMYNLTRDGFSLLVMGFTGDKAYKWKIEFIKAFNLMEAELNRIKATQQNSQKPLTQIEILQSSVAILAEQEKRVSLLEDKTGDLHKEQLKVKHNINRLLNNDNYMTLIAFMNLHGINQKGLHLPSLGKKAKKLSQEQGAFMGGAVIDPRYGRINTYSTEILKQIFKIA